MNLLKNLNREDSVRIILHTVPKFLKGMWHKLFLKNSKGALFIGKKVDLTYRNKIIVGRNVKFESYSEIQGLAKEGLTFGNNISIGRGTMIRPSSYYGGDLGIGLVIGDNSSIGPHSYIGCSGKIVIGRNVMFGPKCSLFAENHNFESLNTKIKKQGVCRKGITIEDDCWIGSNVIILDGVKIGKGCVIAAGTLVNKDIAPYSIVMDKRQKNRRER